MMYDLKKVIESNTVDGVVDYDKVMGVIDNDYVNPIVAKKADESKLLPKAISKVIQDLGIDGESIDDLKLYVKKLGGSTDEIKEENLQLTKKIKELEGEFSQTLEAKTKLENDIKEKTQIDKIKQLGVTDKKQIEFLKWDFNRQVNDETTFDDVYNKYVKENEIKTSTKFIKDDFGGGGDGDGLDIKSAFDSKRSLTRRK